MNRRLVPMVLLCFLTTGIAVADTNSAAPVHSEISALASLSHAWQQRTTNNEIRPDAYSVSPHSYLLQPSTIEYNRLFSSHPFSLHVQTDNLTLNYTPVDNQFSLNNGNWNYQLNADQKALGIRYSLRFCLACRE